MKSRRDAFRRLKVGAAAVLGCLSLGTVAHGQVRPLERTVHRLDGGTSAGFSLFGTGVSGRLGVWTGASTLTGYAGLTATSGGALSAASLTSAGLVQTASLKVTGGTPGVGKVLTGDALGNATWQAPAGVSGLTAGRVPFAASATSLTDSAALTAAAAVATDNTTNFLRVTGTLPASPSADVNGVYVDITGNGSSSHRQNGFAAALKAGYTGTSGTAGVFGTNATVAAGTVWYSGAAGVWGDATAIASKTNIGVGGWAAGSSRFSGGSDIYGAAFMAYAANETLYATATAGFTAYPTSAPNAYGGHFAFTQNYNTVPKPSGYCALVADNGPIAASVFRANDAASTVFSVEDGGYLTGAQGGSAGTVAWGLPAASPQAYTHTLAGSARATTDTDTAGASVTLQSGVGTGAGAASSIAFKTPTVGATGTAAQTMTTRMTIKTVSINLANIPAYADNAAATGAGLVAGDLYYTDSAGEYVLKIAH